MGINSIKRNMFFALIALVGAFAAIFLSPVWVYGMEYQDTIDNEGMDDQGFMNIGESYEFENITMLSSGGDRSDGEVIISGSDTQDYPISDFTDVQYISNSDYFLINPRHHVNDGSDNSGGTCTTVAVQMLLGYHNFYSDRRLIPTSGNGRTFLNEDYGNLAFHPEFPRALVSGQGCTRIGTEDGVYEEIFDLTWISSWYGIGQAIGLVKDGAIRFLNNHTPASVRTNITISSGFFSKSTAQTEIDEGKPIVLGVEPIFSGADSFHVVIAYGYAQLDGQDGFLVHYGWGARRTQVWMPASWFAFQITMNVNHTHSFTDTGINLNDTHRGVQCTCGYTKPDSLYDVSGNTITCVRYPLSGPITIPGVYKEVPITTIGISAFAFQTQMSQITIPASVTNIGPYAFANCTSLSSITIPSSVTSLGSGLLSGCPNLTSITIPFVGNSRTATGNDAKFGYIFGTSSYTGGRSTNQNGITYFIPIDLTTVIITSGTNIPQDAFSYCSYLTNITIPNTVTSIGSNAFNGCTNLTNMTIPNSVTSLGSSVLSGCSGLTSITIPFVGKSRTAIGYDSRFGYLFGTSSFTGGEAINQNSIIYYFPTYLTTVVITDGATIPTDAFSNCYLLTNITIPNTVTSIGSNAFSNCSGLANITIPNTVTSIGSNAFSNCSGLANITIPNSVTSIGLNSFSYCLGLANITISNTVTSIGSNAFKYCQSLTSLTIPNSVTSLGSNALSGCFDLQSITIPFVGKSRTATGNDAKFVYIFGTIPTQLKTVVITDGTNIPQDAFYGCSNLTSIAIPNTVTSIGSNAFYGCHNLTSFTIPSSVTNLGSNVFYGCAHLSSLLYNVVVTASGYYNIQIENISSVIVKIDGVINYFPNNIQQKYLTAGNHTIQAESANIATMVSFPIIASTNYIPYYIDIDNIYKVFYDGPEMQYIA